MLEQMQDYNEYHLMIYGIVILSMVIGASVHAAQFFLICMKSSKNLHNQMFHKLLNAQPRFFDVNPSGETVLDIFTKLYGVFQGEF